MVLCSRLPRPGEQRALFAPVTTLWLGLQGVVGITLIFGIVRKELTILTLAVIFGTTNFATIMVPVQLIALAIVLGGLAYQGPGLFM